MPCALGELDSVCRAMRLDPHFQEAAPEDVEDLLALLALVPWGELLHPETLRLNRTFDASSRLVGGADADLISGEMMVDFKTTKSAKMEAASLDQLLGYLLLARHCRREDGAFPVISRLGLYFVRARAAVDRGRCDLDDPPAVRRSGGLVHQASDGAARPVVRTPGSPALSLKNWPPNMTIGEVMKQLAARQQQGAGAPGIPQATAPTAGSEPPTTD